MKGTCQSLLHFVGSAEYQGMVQFPHLGPSGHSYGLQNCRETESTVPSTSKEEINIVQI
jgi:hypothetical protein